MFSLDEDHERLFQHYQNACEVALSAGQADRYVWNLRQRLAQRKPAENLRDLAEEVTLWSTERSLSAHFDALAALAAAQLTPESLAEISAEPASATPSVLESDPAVAYSLAGWSGLQPAQAELLHQLARQIVDHQPGNGSARVALGFSDYRVGQFQAALDSIQSGRELDEAGVDNILVEAMAQYRLGEVDRAKGMLAMASAWIQEASMSMAGLDSIRLWKEAAEVLGVPRRVPTAEEAHAEVTSEMIMSVFPVGLSSEIHRLRRSSLWASCGYWEQAEHELSEVIQQLPTEPRLWNRRALTMLAR